MEQLPLNNFEGRVLSYAILKARSAEATTLWSKDALFGIVT